MSPAIFNGAAMEQYLGLAQHLVWRSVEDDLPRDLEEVLVHLGPKNIRIAYRVGGAWVQAVNGEHLEPNFWLPLPPPPKSDDEIDIMDEYDHIERAAAGITLGEVKE